MKIALLVKRFTRSGGKERYVVELAHDLGRRGHEVHVYADTCGEELPVGGRFVAVRRRRAFSSVGDTLSFIRATTALVRKEDYDIVHSHERNFCQEIVTLHSLSFLEGLEKYPLLRRLDQKYLSLRSLRYQWLEKKQMRSPWLVAVSGVVAADARRYYGRKDQVAVIPPGVDISLFDPAMIHRERAAARRGHGLGDEEIAVLFVGSAFQRKGLDRVLRSLRPQMRLFVVGKGDKKGHFDKLVRDLGLGEQVVFTGMVDEVRPYYALADILVLPSRSEAFGMSVLEGMACGLPVVVSANSGVADLVQDGENGFVVNNTSIFADRLAELAQAPDMRRRLGTAARITAEDYTWRRVGADHERLYQQVMEARCG